MPQFLPFYELPSFINHHNCQEPSLYSTRIALRCLPILGGEKSDWLDAT